LRLLFGLTYYRPHVSGLTIHAQRLAEALVARGHEVTVLTSRYDRVLAREDRLNGVRIVRAPVAFRISKGVVMPFYIRRSLPQLRRADVAVVNLPNTPCEVLGLALPARLLKRPVVAIYHCDVQLPQGCLNRCVERVAKRSHALAGRLVDRIVTYTEDYARYSPFLQRFQSKVEVIPPPISLHGCGEDEVAAFRNKHAPAGERLIGFPARFAAEKGVEILLNALPAIPRKIGNVKVLFAGEYEDVRGEAEYRRRLEELLENQSSRLSFLGVVRPEKMSVFYRACDVVVLPSVNCTESFGLVQVESMLCGTPVVASDLPGVRVPVRKTGMGRLVPAQDPDALAEAVGDVIQNAEIYVRKREEIEKHFSLPETVDRYQDMFESLCGGRNT